jgi:hypothetical protein
VLNRASTPCNSSSSPGGMAWPSTVAGCAVPSAPKSWCWSSRSESVAATSSTEGVDCKL